MTQGYNQRLRMVHLATGCLSLVIDTLWSSCSSTYIPAWSLSNMMSYSSSSSSSSAFSRLRYTWRLLFSRKAALQRSSASVPTVTRGVSRLCFRARLPFGQRSVFRIMFWCLFHQVHSRHPDLPGVLRHSVKLRAFTREACLRSHVMPMISQNDNRR
jgi:hypothetical protein